MTGYRNGTTIHNLETYGYYWSATCFEGPMYSYYIRFHEGVVDPSSADYRNLGYAVRLVRDAE